MEGGGDSGGGGFESGGTIDAGASFEGVSAVADIEFLDSPLTGEIAALDAAFEISEPTIGEELTAATIAVREAVDVDPLLVDTINEIGARVLAGLTDGETTPAQVEPHDLGDEIPAEEAELEIDSLPQPLTVAEEATENYYLFRDTSSPTETDELEMIWSLPPATASSVPEIETNSDLLPETATDEVLLDEDADSQEVFSSLIASHAMSLDNTSTVTTQGLERGQLYTDVTRYAETTSGLLLIQNIRTLEDGQVRSEVLTARSLQQFNKVREINLNKPKSIVEVEQMKDTPLYHLKWRNGPVEGATEFPADIEISLRDEFAAQPWQNESHGNNPITVSNKSKKPDLNESAKVVGKVRGALDRARPRDKQPEVRKTSVLYSQEKEI